MLALKPTYQDEVRIKPAASNAENILLFAMAKEKSQFRNGGGRTLEEDDVWIKDCRACLHLSSRSLMKPCSIDTYMSNYVNEEAARLDVRS